MDIPDTYTTDVFIDFYNVCMSVCQVQYVAIIRHFNGATIALELRGNVFEVRRQYFSPAIRGFAESTLPSVTSSTTIASVMQVKK